MSTGEKYVVGAYLVVFVTVLVYVAIIAAKLARLERETASWRSSRGSARRPSG